MIRFFNRESQAVIFAKHAGEHGRSASSDLLGAARFGTKLDNVQAVPEPALYVLACIGIIGYIALRCRYQGRRKRR